MRLATTLPLLLSCVGVVEEAMIVCAECGEGIKNEYQWKDVSSVGGRVGGQAGFKGDLFVLHVGEKVGAAFTELGVRMFRLRERLVVLS